MQLKNSLKNVTLELNIKGLYRNNLGKLQLPDAMKRYSYLKELYVEGLRMLKIK